MGAPNLMPGGPGLALISSRAKLRLRPAARDFGVASTRVCAPQESLQRELITARSVAFDALLLLSIPEKNQQVAINLLRV